MDKLISVIVPIYNVEKYLTKCIESIINQTYKNLEIILVDDGSPDNCPIICDEYAKKDSRIKVIHKKNGGLSDARNYGMSLATGEYISFIDSDDYIDENMYEQMVTALIDNNADIVSCAINDVYNDKIETKNIKQELYNTELAIKDLLLEINLTQTVWNKLYKKEIIEGITFEKYKINEDDFWTYQIIANSKRIITINKPFYYYIHRESSIMGQGYSEKNLDGLEARYKQYEFIKKNYPNLVFIARKEYFFMEYFYIKNYYKITIKIKKRMLLYKII